MTATNICSDFGGKWDSTPFSSYGQLDTHLALKLLAPVYQGKEHCQLRKREREREVGV